MVNKNILRLLLGSVAALALILCAGCDEKKPPASPPSPPPATEKPADKGTKPDVTKEAKKMDIKIYYPDESGNKLVAVSRQIKCAPEDKYQATIESLMSGVAEKDHAVAILPRQAQLNRITVNGEVATIDFSQELIKNFVGGSTGEEMLVASIVNTLTEFPEIKKVKILVDGKTVETISGHMDLSAPLDRMVDLLP